MASKTVSDAIARIAARTGRSIDDVTELWAERAAIREYDAGCRRASAERDALDDIANVMLRDIVYVVHQRMPSKSPTPHREPDADERGGRRDYDSDDPRPRRHIGTHDAPMQTPRRQHGTHDAPTRPVPHRRPGC